MSLKRYYIDSQRLTLEERTALYEKVDNLSFLTSIVVPKPGCYEVIWDSDKDIREVISFPPQCVVTPL